MSNTTGQLATSHWVVAYDRTLRERLGRVLASHRSMFELLGVYLAAAFVIDALTPQASVLHLHVYDAVFVLMIACVSYVGSLTFAVEEGVAYYIQAGYISNSGELHVNLQEVPPPANDNFADATVIPSPLPFDETVDAAGATAEAGEPLSSCAGYGGP